MSNFLRDNADLTFYLEQGLDFGALIRSGAPLWSTGDAAARELELKEIFGETASLVGAFAARQVAPFAKDLDRERFALDDGVVRSPARITSIFDRLGALEVHGMCLPYELGGAAVPTAVYFMNMELLARADAAVAGHYSFFGGIAVALLLYSLREGSTRFDAAGKLVDSRFRAPILDIAGGQAWGCMAITEPHAGSDMAALRCRAVRDGSGRWRLYGQKCFISSGHGRYALVIARTDDGSQGLKGLGMFFVDAQPDGARARTVAVDRIEEKLGQHASCTAALHFEGTPAELIGEPGAGFAQMLMLMNGARLGVAFQAIGVSEAAYRASKAYADDRQTMGLPIARHEMIADYLDEAHTTIRGLRALAMHAAFHEELARRIDVTLHATPHLSDVERRTLQRRLRRHRHEARRATPLLKYAAAEDAVAICQRALQIHGGHGYMKDHGVEKLLRDVLVLPIYEGTSQIQALMAMKDTLRAVMSNPHRFLRRLTQARWRSVSARDPLERRVARVRLLALGAEQALIARSAGGRFRALQKTPFSQWPAALRESWNVRRDFALARLHAERLTRILADDLVCEVLFEQARRFPERREICEQYVERVEPRCRHLHEQITTTGSRLLVALGAGEPETEREAG